MGLRTKGGMWCPRCQRPVVGVKATHAFRNILSVLLLPLTAALSIFGLRVSPYVCPRCGSRVRRIPLGQPSGAGAPAGPARSTPSWTPSPETTALAEAAEARLRHHREARQKSSPKAP